MRDSTIETLTPLLNVLRGYLVLQEVRPAAFHLDGRDFIHFHEESEGLFADVRLSKGRFRLPVSTPPEQAELLDRLDRLLGQLESLSRRMGHGKKRNPRPVTPRRRHERRAGDQTKKSAAEGSD
ncbi:MAG TPA: hypothetical protein VFV34_00555 [Blastocatellia bacterium]|nr:hypothetical protein [Blastocatellia bacterium]